MSTTTAVDGGSSAILIHPLILLDMCDHHYRTGHSEGASGVGASATSPSRWACGLLFGVQSGPRVELFNTCEMRVDDEGGRYTIDTKFADVQMGLVSKVFPTYELLGWYAVGGDITPVHLELHRQVCAWNESPLFLLLNPANVATDARHLPLSAYVADYHGSTMTMSPLTFKIETTEVEKVAVDHMTNIAAVGHGGDGGGGLPPSSATAGSAAPTTVDAIIAESACAVAQQLQAHASALRMLKERLGVIRTYLHGVKVGTIPADRSLLRLISTVANSIPVSDAPSLAATHDKELADGLLITYLSSMARGSHAMADLLDKVAVASSVGGEERRGQHGGRGGLHAMGGGRDIDDAMMAMAGSRG